MNPLASHWLRLTLWLLVASPVVALVVVLTTDAPFEMALFITLYMWAFVCGILALIALVGVVARLVGRGVRAIRR